MSDRQTAAQMALDTVDRCYKMLLSEPDTNGALFKAENILRELLVDLRTALAQGEQEPVAYVPVHPRTGPLWSMATDAPNPERLPTYPLMPLYTTPHSATHSADSAESFGKPQREWRSLTSAQRKVLWNLTKKPSEYGEMIDAKLRELNT